MNALVLALALRLAGIRIVPARVILGALAGAVIACLAKGLPRIQAMLMWLPAAMVMMRIAQGGGSSKRMLVNALLLACAAGFVGGMVLALWGATGSLEIAYALGIIASGCIGLCAVRRRAQVHGCVRVVCTYRGKRAVLEAMIDSGNTLRDYLTHLPVIVIPEESARRALALEDTPMRPIFAQTAGGRQQMRVLPLQGIELEMDGMRQSIRAVIALSPRMSPSVPALVPDTLLGEARNSN